MAIAPKLNLLKPQLRECTIFRGERNIVIEDGKAQIVLPREHQAIVDLLDGQHSVRDISSELYCTQGKVSFHSIITTIKLLSEAGMLDGVDQPFTSVADEKSPHEQKPSILNRHLFEVKLKGSLKINFRNDLLFYLLVVLLAGVLVMNHDAFSQLNLSRFLKSPRGYDQALFRIVIFSSIFLTMKSAFQGLLLLVSAGKFGGPYLRLYPYAVTLGINDNSLYSHPKKSIIISYGVVSSLLYFISFGILESIPALRVYRNDLAVLAVLFTFIEMNPYRRSDLTKLFYFFYAENQLKSILPYLKNCTLTGLWKDTGAKLSDEIRYVTYSILAIAWAIGFTVFSMEIILKTFPGLVYQIQTGSPASKYSAMVVMATLVFITGYLLLDLLHTLGKNIISPLLAPLTKFKLRAKAYKLEDVDPAEVRSGLKRHMLFNQFSEEAIDFLFENGTIRSLKKGQNLILQGESNGDVFFLIRGSVDVSVQEKTGRIKHIVTLGPSTVLGEMAILEKTVRTATVKASEDIVFLELPEKFFALFMKLDQFKPDALKLKSRIEISQFVSSANLFKDFPPEVMNIFVEAGDLVLFPKGHNIVDEGEEDKTFYLLIKGKVEVLKNSQVIAELGQGDFFGEVALIANVPRTATIKTCEDSLFLYIEDEKFWNILSENIELAMYIESVGRHRMVDAA
ncbi:MAG TPA: cyclic nucleotide-binding domain-containing protein [Bacteriovoracaceae bacterium]|nr:cyclic nucleotide-binding domain-containing protein [Bacteriovoracaceae bacterium]